MRCVLCVVSMLVLAAATARGEIIDDFGASSSSSNYTAMVIWPPEGATPATWAVDGGQFKPSTSGDDTLFFRNDYTFDVGDTIGLDLCALDNSYSTTGLALNKSLTTISYDNRSYVQRGPTGSYTLTINSGTAAALTDFALAQPATLTLTRTSDSAFSYAFIYTNTSNAVVTSTGTSSGLTAGAYYFAIETYQLGTATDNLSHTAVPEPSTVALLAAGLFGLLAYAWRRR